MPAQSQIADATAKPIHGCHRIGKRSQTTPPAPAIKTLSTSSCQGHTRPGGLQQPVPPDTPNPAPDPDQTSSPAARRSPPVPSARPYKTHARHHPEASDAETNQTDPLQQHAHRGYKHESHP